MINIVNNFLVCFLCFISATCLTMDHIENSNKINQSPLSNSKIALERNGYTNELVSGSFSVTNREIYKDIGNTSTIDEIIISKPLKLKTMNIRISQAFDLLINSEKGPVFELFADGHIEIPHIEYDDNELLETSTIPCWQPLVKGKPGQVLSTCNKE